MDRHKSLTVSLLNYRSTGESRMSDAVHEMLEAIKILVEDSVSDINVKMEILERKVEGLEKNEQETAQVQQDIEDFRKRLDGFDQHVARFHSDFHVHYPPNVLTYTGGRSKKISKK